MFLISTRNSSLWKLNESLRKVMVDFMETASSGKMQSKNFRIMYPCLMKKLFHKCESFDKQVTYIWILIQIVQDMRFAFEYRFPIIFRIQTSGSDRKPHFKKIFAFLEKKSTKTKKMEWEILQGEYNRLFH